MKNIEAYQGLFNHIKNEYGLILVKSEMDEIIRLSKLTREKYDEIELIKNQKTMKKLLLISLFLTSQILSSQTNYELTRKQHFWNEAKIAGIMIGEVTLSAISDGLYDNGYKLESKIIELVAKGLLAYGVREIIIQQGNFGRALVKYVGFRVSLYDFSYNATRGLPLGYIGTRHLFGTKPVKNSVLRLACNTGATRYISHFH